MVLLCTYRHQKGLGRPSLQGLEVGSWIPNWEETSESSFLSLLALALHAQKHKCYLKFTSSPKQSKTY